MEDSLVEENKKLKKENDVLKYILGKNNLMDKNTIKMAKYLIKTAPDEECRKIAENTLKIAEELSKDIEKILKENDFD